MAWRDRLKKRTAHLIRYLGKAGTKAARAVDNLSQRYGFIKVIRQAVANFFGHGMTVHAGNFAYSAFLAVFPLILLVAAAVGLVFNNNPEVMQRAIDASVELFPGMTSTMERIVDSLVRLRGVVGIVGLVGLLWTVSKIAFAIQTGFGEVWELSKRSFVKKKLFAIGIMLLLILIGLAGLLVTFLSSHFLSWLSERVGPLVSALSLVISVLFVPAASMVIFTVLYHAIPLGQTGWKEALWGALVASLLLYATHNLMGFYYSRISNAEALYGSIGALLGLVLWLYLVGIIVFLGAEITHALQIRWEAGDADAEDQA